MTSRSRNLIRKEAAVLPYAMVHSRRTAKHILTTDARNFLCPYHKELSKKGEIWDGGEASSREYRFATGTPHQRNVAKSINEDPRPLHPGYLSCGCPEDPVLLEAALRKITRVKSDYSGALESLQGKLMHPRDRLFFATTFTDWTGLAVDDLYRFDSKGNSRTYANILDKQIAVLQTRRRNLNFYSVSPTNPSPSDDEDDAGSTSDKDLIAELQAEAEAQAKSAGNGGSGTMDIDTLG